MKSKSFLILTLICAVLGSLAWILLQDKKPAAISAPDAQILADTDVNAAASLSLRAAEDTLTLEKTGDIWTVTERYGYPADFGKIVDLIKKLKEMKSGRQFAVTDAIRDRLGLHDPEGDTGETDTRAVRVVLKDASGKVLADLFIGKAREADAGYGGHYLLPAGSDTVLLVDREFSVKDQKPGDWLDKELLDIAPDSVKQVIVRAADDTVLFTIAREKKGAAPSLTPMPEGRKGNQGKLTALMGALSSFRIEDVADPALPEDETGLGAAASLEFHQFDGTVTRIRASTVKEGENTRVYCRVSVSFEAPEAAPEAGENADAGENTDAAAPDDEAGKTEKAKEDAPDPAALAAAAEKTNARIGKWTFIVPQWKAERLSAELETYLEEIKEEKPEEKTASGAGDQS